MKSLIEQLRHARRVSTPLIAIATADPAATMQSIRQLYEGPAEGGSERTPIPILRWDALNGLMALNKAGKQALAALIGEKEDEWAAQTTNPGAALAIMANLPGDQRGGDGKVSVRGSVVFMLNGQRFLEDRTGVDNAQIIQGIWNLRDLYKSNRRTLYILGPAFTFPPELMQDVIYYDEPLPAEAELREIINAQAKSAGVKLEDSLVEQAVDAVRSLSAFTAEQLTAMSLTPKEGLDVEQLWQRKISVLEQTPGLAVDRGTESFEETGGLEQFKKFGQKLTSGPKCPLVFVRLDEIEKMLGGIGTAGAGDNTGVSQDALGVLLREMEDNDWAGMICLGPPGTGKSLVTKGLANSASKVSGRRVLSVSLDLGATRGSLVGESERKIRGAIKALKALAGRSRIVFAATCNKLEILPPELRRRFRLGIWFFDLPTAQERQAIWKINLAKYGMTTNVKTGVGPVPDDTNWTGADIRNVCDIADRLRCTLKEATEYIVPVAKSDPGSIDRLRKLADGKFLSASYPGAYKATATLDPTRPVDASAPVRRARVQEEDV